MQYAESESGTATIMVVPKGTQPPNAVPPFDADTTANKHAQSPTVSNEDVAATDDQSGN